MLDMARKDILPAMSSYSTELADAAITKGSLCAEADCSYEQDNLKNLCALIGTAYRAVNKLEQDLLRSKSISDMAQLAEFYQSTIIEDMKSLRIASDQMESIASSKKWPYPSYGELLFGVR